MALVFAHRTCPLQEAENSLAGIERAGSVGADGVEIDVRLTRDGVPVLVHDRTMWRIGRWPLPTRWTSFARLRRIARRDDGLQIPAFAEALSALPSGVRLVIDLKDPRAVMPTIDEIRRHFVQKSRRFGEHRSCHFIVHIYREGQVEMLFGSGHRHIEQPTFFFQIIFGEKRIGRGESAIDQPNHKHAPPF